MLQGGICTIQINSYGNAQAVIASLQQTLTCSRARRLLGALALFVVLLLLDFAVIFRLGKR